MKKSVMVALGLCMAGIAAIALVYLRAPRTAAKGSTGAVTGRGSAGQVVASHPSERAPEPQVSARPVLTSSRDPKLNERLRDAEEVRRRIAELGRKATSPGSRLSHAAPQTMPAVEGSGNQVGKPLGEYVGRLLKAQFNPVAASCYDELLSREPSAAGSLILDVKVVGDTRVGGVVQDVEIDPESTLNDGEFRLCMRESMFATVFDAPPGGEGEVTFSYPLRLSPDEPEDRAKRRK